MDVFILELARERAHHRVLARSRLVLMQCLFHVVRVLTGKYRIDRQDSDTVRAMAGRA